VFRLGTALQDQGYWILNDVIWRKSNPMPNFRGRRFTNAHETLVWAARGPESRYRFNYAAMKALNDDLQMRSDWLIPLCTGGERLRDDAGAKLHPTQKPEALLHRVILACTSPGEVILDPFLGSGTTAAVAKRLGRRFIGIEREQTYADAALARIAATEPAPDDAAAALPSKKEQPRIPFGSLVERGLVPAGARLFDRQKRWEATVGADGTLRCGHATGSIHKVGATVQEAPSCNGWLFWHLEQRDGRLRVIDELREEVLRQM
jgi:modification methylase